MKTVGITKYHNWCSSNHSDVMSDRTKMTQQMASIFGISLKHASSQIGIYINAVRASLNGGKLDFRKESDIVPTNRVQRLERPMVKVYPIRTETQGNKIILTYDSRANYL